MADTGHTHPSPDPWRRIKATDLRRECQACGGSGREFKVSVEQFPGIAHSHVTSRYVGPCKPCDGRGSIKPTKWKP